MEVVNSIPEVYSSIAWTTFWIWFAKSAVEFVSGLVAVLSVLGVGILGFKKVIKNVRIENEYGG